MVKFNSIKQRVNGNGSITFFVENDKNRKISEDNFFDLYPDVAIDGYVYETKDIEYVNISHVAKGNIIGITVNETV